MDHLKNAWTYDLGNELERQKYLAARIKAELDFATQLADIEGRSTWPKLIEKARAAVADAARKPAQFAKAVAAAEEVLAPIGKAAKKYTMHAIGHAHIDMNWLWSWAETVAVTNDTFTTVLRLMDEFSEFTFGQSQASVYEILRQYNPAMLDQVRRRVAEGRWDVLAAHWVEGDKNLASGEALAHHLLYTRQFFREHFGLSPADVPIDWEPDTFGHAATIPSIVARGGVKFYYMCRGGAAALPPVFWWQGSDGRRVLVNKEVAWYNGRIDEGNIVGMLKFVRETSFKDWLLVYGVGDHGGGPTRRDLLRARDMNDWPVWPNIRHTTLRRYFELLQREGDRWPVVERELNFEFTGCYTSQSDIKKANRYGENYSNEAQAAAAVAWRALGLAHPDAHIRQGWINTLFGQFHDILPGSGIRATRDYQMGLFQQTCAATSTVKTQSWRGLAAAIDTLFAGAEPPGSRPAELAASIAGRALGGGAGRGAMDGGLSTAAHVVDGPRPFVVVNPLAIAREDTVSATIWDAGTGSLSGDAAGKTFVARTPEGRAIAAQRIGKGDYWGHDFIELAVPVAAGALGYASFAIEEGEAPAAGTVQAVEGIRGGEKVRIGSTCTMQNEHLLVEIDYATGGISKLVDKASGRDLAVPGQPMAVLDYFVERPHGMSAWLINDPIERPCPLKIVSMQMPHKGPYLAAVVVKYAINDSEITLTMQLRQGAPFIELSIDAKWLEIGSPAKGTPNLGIRFPMAVADAAGRYEVPFGSVTRAADGSQEVPALRWADIFGKSAGGETAGCVVANDCKYGHCLDGSTLRVTLLRSTYTPDPLPEVSQHSMRLALSPHDGEMAPSRCAAIGAALSHPLAVVATDVHAGKLPPAAELISCDVGSVAITCVKKALQDDSLIIRMAELDGTAVSASVKFHEMLGQIAGVEAVDLLEQAIDGCVAFSGNTINLDIAPHEIATLKVGFAASAR